jgi:hypothetical protein
MAVQDNTLYHDNLGAQTGGTVYVDEDKDVRDWGTLNRSGGVIVGSSLADLATRSAASLSSGNLAYARLPTGADTWNASPTISGTLTVGGRLLIGHSVITGSSDGDIILGAGKAIRGLNAAGTAVGSGVQVGNNALRLVMVNDFLELWGAIYSGSAGSVVKYLRVWDNNAGAEFRIPLHAVS